MNKKDLIRLPHGEYSLTDGIYDYTLTKSGSEYHTAFYRIRLKGSTMGNSVCLFETMEKETDMLGDYKHPVISAMSGVGGIRVHSEGLPNDIYKLRFVPKTTFKKWSENLKQY